MEIISGMLVKDLNFRYLIFRYFYCKNPTFLRRIQVIKPTEDPLNE